MRFERFGMRGAAALIAAPIIAFFGTNVKMHQTSRESVAYVDELATLAPAAGMQLFAILPFTSLASVIPAAHRAGMWIGAQNMHWPAAGEYTGEVSAAMLCDLGVDLVLVGHAERRHAFGDTDVVVRRKVEVALAHGLRVVLCVGETAEEHRYGASAETLVRQLKFALHGVANAANVIVAYEPVWAIGEAGSSADIATVAEAVAAIRAFTGTLPLLYGGSIDAGSAPGYAGITGIDGLFVGRAARSARGFSEVARAAYPRSFSEHQYAAADRPHQEE